MADTKKKGKKGKKREADDAAGGDQMTAVDRQFYELQVADLNNKLSRLRAGNAKLEERNEELESKMRQIEEDKSDTTAYLNRTLNEKLNIISELEDKLSELSKVRDDENVEFKRVLNEREAKYKAMHDQLTSEIKLLTGKLNSMEEFRIQRDELLAKFDAQETELKEQHKRHKQILYEMERKVILDKDRLRKEVENRLLQLSTEFTKSNEIRVAAHTQRLVRENIALNNEMDRIMFTIERLKREQDDMKRQNHHVRAKNQAIEIENARLIRTAQGHIKIIEQLTEAYETLQNRTADLRNAYKMFETTNNKLKDTENSHKKLHHKVRILEQHIHAINTQRQALTADIMLNHQQLDHIQDILNKVKLTIMSAIRGQNVSPSACDFEFRMSQRETLLDDLLNILNELEHLPTERPSMESVQNYIYLQGNLGILPITESVETVVFSEHKLPPIPTFSTEKLQTPRVSIISMRTPSDPVLDVISGSAIQFEESEEQLGPDEVDDEGEESEVDLAPKPRKRSIRKASKVEELSVDEEQAAAGSVEVVDEGDILIDPIDGSREKYSTSPE